ncbi:vit family domain-containing [Trichoderma arundinaceum]|uniref:Vit family domain-containing n=1 Tax=Trichoderma arundinaceum TaxID=490622 RepID=A0A395NJS0_TRIAR|nr:vit family domain-containing [Trichoderma arundinaceum]
MASLKTDGIISGDMNYEQRLFQYTLNTGTGEPHFIMFRGLQRLNIIQLQIELAQFKKSAWDTKQLPKAKSEELTRLLHDYTNAIRDYEYLNKMVPITGSQARNQRLDIEQAFAEVGNLSEDPGTYRRLPDTSMLASDPLRDILKAILPKSLTYTKREIKRRTPEFLEGQPPTEVSPFVDKLARFIVAFIGGAALVVPMLIMRLPEVTLTKSLVTVSVAVLLFAVVLSLVLRASNTDTMVSTATYAAVLVVFVGTTS